MQEDAAERERAPPVANAGDLFARQTRARMRIENLDELRVDLRIGGDDLVLEQEVRLARVIADQTARFRDENGSRSVRTCETEVLG